MSSPIILIRYQEQIRQETNDDDGEDDGNEEHEPRPATPVAMMDLGRAGSLQEVSTHDRE